MSFSKSLLKEFRDTARAVGKYGIATCSSGNLSHLTSTGEILVSQSKSWLSDLKYNQIVVLNENHEIIKGEKPTGELPLHLAIYRENKTINTVLHCQSPYATTLACMNQIDIDYNAIIEVPIYIGKVATVPFIMPGSVELADAVSKESTKACVIQLSNHGQVICGKSYRDVLQKAVFFELACKIIIGTDLKHKPLTQEHIIQLQDYFSVR